MGGVVGEQIQVWWLHLASTLEVCWFKCVQKSLMKRCQRFKFHRVAYTPYKFILNNVVILHSLKIMLGNSSLSVSLWHIIPINIIIARWKLRYVQKSLLLVPNGTFSNIIIMYLLFFTCHNVQYVNCQYNRYRRIVVLCCTPIAVITTESC